MPLPFVAFNVMTVVSQTRMEEVVLVPSTAVGLVAEGAVLNVADSPPVIKYSTRASMQPQNVAGKTVNGSIAGLQLANKAINKKEKRMVFIMRILVNK